MKKTNLLWVTFCKLFTVSKIINRSNSKTIQITYDKNKQQIILLHPQRATGKFLKKKIAQIKPGEVYPLDKYQSS